jgi:ribosomal protein L37AE/L43A
MALLTGATTESLGSRFADLSPCPNCGRPLVAPQSSSYLGLGRIEHTWHCDQCGNTFQTKARMAGVVEVPVLADTEPETANG